jgi:catechol 2,3-dioxygenase-like lactoylglutathione lyase family enzyme
MIDHAGFAVADIERSKRFYEAALAPLGLTLVMDIPPEQNAPGGGGRALGFGARLRIGRQSVLLGRR